MKSNSVNPNNRKDDYIPKRRKRRKKKREKAKQNEQKSSVNMIADYLEEVWSDKTTDASSISTNYNLAWSPTGKIVHAGPGLMEFIDPKYNFVIFNYGLEPNVEYSKNIPLSSFEKKLNKEHKHYIITRHLFKNPK